MGGFFVFIPLGGGGKLESVTLMFTQRRRYQDLSFRVFCLGKSLLIEVVYY